MVCPYKLADFVLRLGRAIGVADADLVAWVRAKGVITDPFQIKFFARMVTVLWKLEGR